MLYPLVTSKYYIKQEGLNDLNLFIYRGGSNRRPPANGANALITEPSLLKCGDMLVMYTCHEYNFYCKSDNLIILFRICNNTGTLSNHDITRMKFIF